jgi:hypothetical protein
MHPDLENPAYVSSKSLSSQQLKGATLHYMNGQCVPTGKCDKPFHKYKWDAGGCTPEDSEIKCPPGFKKISATECTMSRKVGGEGRGNAKISGVDPEYSVHANYNFVKFGYRSDGDYDVNGPGIKGRANGIRNRHTTKGSSWVKGKTEYSYAWRNNDGHGTFHWTVKKA